MIRTLQLIDVDEEAATLELRRELDELKHNASEAARRLIAGGNRALDNSFNQVTGVLNWVENILGAIVVDKLKTLPVVGNWADRLGYTTVGFVFAVIRAVVMGFKLLISEHS